MYPALIGGIDASVRHAIGPSARWSVRRAAVILAVLLAHLSLMVSPLHAAHVERADHAEAPPVVEQSAHSSDAAHGSDTALTTSSSDAHAEDHASHTATPPSWHGDGVPTSAPWLSAHEASDEDCRIEWTRTRQQPADTSLLAASAAPGLSGLQLQPSLPAHAALVLPLRRGDIQALLQVYRL